MGPTAGVTSWQLCPECKEWIGAVWRLGGNRSCAPCDTALMVSGDGELYYVRLSSLPKKEATKSHA